RQRQLWIRAIPTGQPPKNAAGTGSHVGSGASNINVTDFFKPKAESESTPAESSSASCPKCGAALPENAKFCLSCGEKIQKPDSDMIVCPGCGKTVPKGKFCFECGYKFVSNTCPKCGAALPEGAKFCFECGEKI
ncbi:MAG: zinc ribbon domain-containing protein, partial [Ruminiclostridium sp.]|nr:zinc ribbon domain-containing protein [Ruminiclostridium sp.]